MCLWKQWKYAFKILFATLCLEIISFLLFIIGYKVGTHNENPCGNTEKANTPQLVRNTNIFQIEILESVILRPVNW